MEILFDLPFLDTSLFKWVVLPLLIFFSRILDVSLGTLRFIFISKGYKFIAPVLGFFEVLIWILVMGQIVQNLTNVMYYIAYAGGFAMGNFIGMLIDRKLSLGIVIIRVIFKKTDSDLLEYLRSKNYGITVIEGKGATGKVRILFSVILRKEIDEFVSIVRKFKPNAFYSIEDVRFVSEGVFPAKNSRLRLLKRK
jgi:uncharacterized protein YebE (UPF0316 family)